MVATVLGMIFESQLGIKLHVIAWIGALFLVATRTISEKVAVNAIDMKTILLFVGSLALAQALVKTGAGAMIADTIIQSLCDNPSPFMLLAVVFCIAAILTQFMSNTATTALLVPISLALAQQVGADPKAVLMATVIGGSVAFATPIGCPPNTMVYNVAGYSFMDLCQSRWSLPNLSNDHFTHFITDFLPVLPLILSGKTFLIKIFLGFSICTDCNLGSVHPIS